MTITAPAPAPAAAPRSTGHGGGFWYVAFAFLVAMAFSTVPAPLFPVYQARDGFSTFMITVVFAAYAVGVATALVLAGHVSDWLGRRRVLVPALVLEPGRRRALPQRCRPRHPVGGPLRQRARRRDADGDRHRRARRPRRPAPPRRRAAPLRGGLDDRQHRRPRGRRPAHRCPRGVGARSPCGPPTSCSWP
ncbi:hypothetical protein [Nocardioides convexus]|uniref:hypothetical protein n=1 Tax=Nocardioides convexus TaxID=2712224 RepID=UPI0024181C2D|nr:hypothetical protein [Nocardioides convexus]